MFPMFSLSNTLQVQRNIGDEVSDVRSGKLLAALFNTTQSLIKSGIHEHQLLYNSIDFTVTTLY